MPSDHTPAPSCVIPGVYRADPSHPPQPPRDAKAIEIRDASDRVIGYAWVIAEHADDAFYAASWAYVELRLNGPTLPPFPRPALVR